MLTEAALIYRCRKAPGCRCRRCPGVVDRCPPNIRRWEDGTRPISGPAWVALEYMLREAGEIALAEQVAEVVERRQIASAQTEPSAC